MAGKNKSDATIVVKKFEEGGHGHHGGAWKVAYADFVTAMMAFFLLMWLLNATDQEKRRGIADYFNPTHVMARGASGSAQPFGGRTPNSDGDQVSDAGAVRIERGERPARIDLDEEEGESNADETTPRPAARPENAASEVAAGRDGMAPGASAIPTAGEAPGNGQDLAAAQAGQGGQGANQAAQAAQMAPPTPESLTEQELRAEVARREREAFERAAAELRAAVQMDPGLADLARQLVIEQVPEGLRIQILDAERQPMFATGSAAPNERARGLLAKVAAVAARMPNGISIAGHTDATPFRGTERSNWELSADRANAVRRFLLDSGIREGRLQSVSGQADRTPLLPEQPNAAANRRVAITLLRAAPDAGAGAGVPAR